jgi:hypothetical protein
MARKTHHAPSHNTVITENNPSEHELSLMRSPIEKALAGGKGSGLLQSANVKSGQRDGGDVGGLARLP